MIIHTHDVELVNRVVNSVGVRAFVNADHGYVDLAAAVGPRSTHTGVVALVNDVGDALALFELEHEGVYQGHVMFSETCRGRRAIETGRAMLRHMFDHGAQIIYGATPLENRAARWFNRQIGFAALWHDETHEIFEIRRPH